MVSRVAELAGAVVIILIGFTAVCALTNDPTDRSQSEMGPVRHSSFGFIGSALEDGYTAQMALAQFPLPLSQGSDGPQTEDLIASIQVELAERGFDPGPADGTQHPATREAIRVYQENFGLDVTGEPTPHLLDHLRLTRPLGHAVETPDGGTRREMLARVQRRLAELGYWPGEINGALTPPTRKAIADFERDNGFVVTGEINHNLIKRLSAGTARVSEPFP